ncbi:hypothetical protein [Hymenobacter sublimis]|uniref:Uncharacterized protein n=1 Tax=Hymenobacter sublimis TaxID=2933777 RepID=A0ABY4J8Y2_9BACT|nr:hypothetical protein [Hymenobacter sublimis]UPL49267.1 hypothetical protein MWH26_19075 [Hymenobacter sublimis]
MSVLSSSEEPATTAASSATAGIPCAALAAPAPDAVPAHLLWVGEYLIGNPQQEQLSGHPDIRY